MQDSIGIILVLAVLILMSAYFSATETAFSSLNRIRMKNMAADGNRRAALTLKLADDYDRLLSTILIGNNIVNIASASLATVIFVDAFGDIGVTLSTVVMTVLVLIFGEISPKSLAKERPEAFAMFSAPIIRFFLLILRPLNALFMLWRKLLTVVFKTSAAQTSFSGDELLTIVEEATQEGGLEPQEGALIRSAIEFNDREVSDILTPRVEIAAVPGDASDEMVRERFAGSGFTRLPVYAGDIDHIIGMLHLKDYINNAGQSVQALMKPVLYTPGTTHLSSLLTRLQNAKVHLAVVTDEYGGTLGIVTLEDVVEELVGEIWDEHDEIVQDFIPIGENEYRVTCSTSLDKMLRLFHLHDDEETDAVTVSGWIMSILGYLPEVGESFDHDSLHVTITKVGGRRVLECTVQQRQPAEAAS